MISLFLYDSFFRSADVPGDPPLAFLILVLDSLLTEDRSQLPAKCIIQQYEWHHPPVGLYSDVLGVGCLICHSQRVQGVKKGSQTPPHHRVAVILGCGVEGRCEWQVEDGFVDDSSPDGGGGNRQHLR